MSNDLALNTARRTVEWYEEQIPLRGCSFSLEDVRQAYRELSKLNHDYGKQVVDKLVNDGTMTAEEWEAKKAFWLENAFRLTVTIYGERDQRIYDEDESIFSSSDLPKTITRIYFTNLTAYRRNANNTDPDNQLEVVLDFSKPPLVDSETLVSSPTPNQSRVSVMARNLVYCRTVQQIVSSHLANKRTWYGFIHRSFAYDVGLWLLLLPLALTLTTFYMDKWLPLGGSLSTYRWAFFLYSIGIITLTYRFITSYTKWAFPVNVLTHNQDKSLKHRLAIIAGAGWFFQQSASAVWSLVTK